jgi:transposase
MTRKRMEITAEVMKEIKERKKKEKDAKIYRRLLFLELKYSKKRNKEIALLLDVTMETLSHWTAIFEEGGVNLLCTLHYEGRRGSVLTPFTEEMKEYIGKENVSTLKALQAWLEKTKEVQVGISWLQEFCKKNSIFLIKRHD